MLATVPRRSGARAASIFSVSSACQSGVSATLSTVPTRSPAILTSPPLTIWLALVKRAWMTYGLSPPTSATASPATPTISAAIATARPAPLMTLPTPPVVGEARYAPVPGASNTNPLRAAPAGRPAGRRAGDPGAVRRRLRGGARQLGDRLLGAAGGGRDRRCARRHGGPVGERGRGSRAARRAGLRLLPAAGPRDRR